MFFFHRGHREHLPVPIQAGTKGTKRKPELLIKDIPESAHKIIAYVKSRSFEEFPEDDKTIDAVVRNFEIIGEAANNLPEEFREAHPEIDWFRLRGFKNRKVHQYFGIDYSIV